MNGLRESEWTKINGTINIMTEERLWGLLEKCWKEEAFFLEHHHRRTAFYSGFITLLLGGGVAGFMQAVGLVEKGVVLLAPALAIVVAELGKRASRRVRQRILEIMCMRAKVEVELNLNAPRAAQGAWYETEPFVQGRHLQSWTQAESGGEFVEQNMTQGAQQQVERIFRVSQVAAVALIAVITAQLVQSW